MEQNATEKSKVNWSALVEFLECCWGAQDTTRAIRNILCLTAELILKHNEDVGWASDDFSNVNFFLQALDEFNKDNNNVKWNKISK